MPSQPRSSRGAPRFPRGLPVTIPRDLPALTRKRAYLLPPSALSVKQEHLRLPSVLPRKRAHLRPSSVLPEGRYRRMFPPAKAGKCSLPLPVYFVTVFPQTFSTPSGESFQVSLSFFPFLLHIFIARLGRRGLLRLLLRRILDSGNCRPDLILVLRHDGGLHFIRSL